MAEPRRTRLIVDIVWNGEDSGRLAQEEYYYEDRELPRVATDWITDGFYDRDDGPRVTVTVVPGATADRGRDSGEALTSVRTVLSRAETALEELGPEGTRREWPLKTGSGTSTPCARPGCSRTPTRRRCGRLCGRSSPC